MKTRPHHAPSSALARDDPATLPCPGTCGSGTRSCRPSSALLRTYLLLTTFVLPLTFACQDDRSADDDGDTISDPQGCRSIRLLAESDAETTTFATTTETTTETTATATDTKPGTDSDATSSTITATDSDSTPTGDPVCGNNILEDGEECDNGDDNGKGKSCSLACTFNTCGNGRDNPDEECDNGDENADDATCTSECKSARCGDSLLLLAGDNPEQCDDGKNGDDLDGCTDKCTLRYTVFVTSTTYAGDLNKEPGDDLLGLDLADLRCQQLADAAGWKDKGTFRAWLSDSTGSPSTRFETAPKDNDDPGFTGTFALLDATEVAFGWEGLTTADDQGNVLMHAIDMDDKASAMLSLGVWSNTTFAGMQISEDPEYHCLNWTSADVKEGGRPGSTTRRDNQWTNFGSYPGQCGNYYRLYCFQVAHP